MNAARVRELLSDSQTMTAADWQSVYDWLNLIQDKEEAGFIIIEDHDGRPTPQKPRKES